MTWQDKINSCGTVGLTEDMLWDFEPRKQTEKGWRKGEDQGRFDRSSLEGQRSLNANKGPTPAEGNFCQTSNSPVKHHIFDRYNRQKDFVDISGRMAKKFYGSTQPQMNHEKAGSWI
jgi:hypothetical protein